MKPAFHEDLLADNLDPLDAKNPETEFAQLFDRLCEDATNGENDRDVAELVVRLLQMFVPNRRKQIVPRTVGLRIIALAWVLSPAYFEGSPSLHNLAKRCGATPTVLANYTARFSRLIQWRNRAQQHAWNWRKSEPPPQPPKRRSGSRPASRREKPGSRSL